MAKGQSNTSERTAVQVCEWEQASRRYPEANQSLRKEDGCGGIVWCLRKFEDLSSVCSIW